MSSLDPPKLRALRPYRVERGGGEFVAFDDSLGLADPSFLLPIDQFFGVVRHFDGARTLAQLRAALPGPTAHDLDDLVRRLDAALVLDGPAFAALREAYRAETVRPAAFAGRSYSGGERALRAQLARYFALEHEGGPSALNGEAPARRLRGVLSPHIDFHRGGHVYTWAYRELVERSDADVYVILGVAHQYCRHRFALTRKDFETPLGTARTDGDYVDRVASFAGGHLFDDELAHRTEHSIEFQVVFLQYLLGGRRDYKIVPILVGSFHDLMEAGADPLTDPEVARFVQALRAAEQEHRGRVAYIGGIDLGHIGREFGDPKLLDAPTLEALRSFDAHMLAHATAADPAAWFRSAAEIENRWRICGLAATYTMLHAMGPAQGRLLRYDQAVNPERTCCVSFASVAFQARDESQDPDVAPVDRLR